MSIAEPATLLTDYLLAAVAAWLGWDLLRRNRSAAQRSRSLWALAFLGLGLSAFTGGTVHGFVNALGERQAAVLWKVTVCLIGVVDWLMLCGSLTAALGRPWRTAALLAATIKLMAYIAFMTTHDEFKYVVYDYGSSMILILLVLAIPGVMRGKPGAGFILAGLLLSFVAAGVQYFHLAPHPRFNHNDLYHVIQIAATWVLALGARRLRDR